MTAPIPLSLATAATWHLKIPEQWQEMQAVQSGSKNIHKTTQAGIVNIQTLYVIDTAGIATMEVEFIWQISFGSINFYSHNQPANHGKASAMLTISSEKSPVPLLSLQESMPGRKLGEIVELPSEIGGIGDYVISDIHDNRNLNVFEFHLRP